MARLTHNLELEGTSGAVALRILGDAGVGGLVTEAFHILDHQGSVREDLLFAVDRQHTGINGSYVEFLRHIIPNYCRGGKNIVHRYGITLA